MNDIDGELEENLKVCFKFKIFKGWNLNSQKIETRKYHLIFKSWKNW